MRITRRIAVALMAPVVIGAAAACTASTSASTAAEGTPSAGRSVNATSAQTATTASSPATGSAESAESAGSGTPGTAGAPSSTAGTNSAGSNAQAAAGTPSCTGSQIKVTLGRGGAATGHDIVALVFVNTSSRTCALQGYPGASIVNGSTDILNATRTLNGFAGDERQLGSAPLVTLAPGAIASANLEWVVDNGEPCGPTGAGTLEVTPPNTTATTKLESMTAGARGVCADFEIHPVVAGSL